MNAEELGLEESQVVFLAMCDECAAGELEILTHIEGREVEDGPAFKAQADDMVRGGFYERVGFGGSKKRHQGARYRHVYRRSEAGEALHAAIERIKELEAEVARLEGGAPTNKRARAGRRPTDKSSTAHR
jgi:hypothetical protein